MNFHHFVRSATHFVSWEPEFIPNLSSGIQTISSRGTTSHKDIKTKKTQHCLIDRRFLQIAEQQHHSNYLLATREKIKKKKEKKNSWLTL